MISRHAASNSFFMGQNPNMGQPRSYSPIIDKCTIVPISACVFALIVSPLLIFVTPIEHTVESLLTEHRPENKIFWPAMAAISVVLVAQNRSRLTSAPHIICLFVYLAFAGASVLWAFSPEISFIRFIQQVMIITSIVLPAMVAARTVDMMRGLFLVFAFASILNVFFVLGGSQNVAAYGSIGQVDIGYPGYFTGKNYLGECATLTILLSLHEMVYPGLRRALGTIVVVIATVLVFLSDSKTALGLALVAPLLGGLTLIARKKRLISPAIILLSIPICYAVLSSISNFSMNRLGYMLYGDSTFTGRTVIWDFVQSEIARRPLLGWGYQSFWLVPGSPSIFEAPGWVKLMPNAHNGYYDTTLEMGYVGYALLVIFIIATLHAIGRVADRDPTRAWLVLSLALYIIMWNYFESLWMRGFEFLWVVFLIIAAEIARYWHFPLTSASFGSRTPRPGVRGPSRVARRPSLRIPTWTRPGFPTWKAGRRSEMNPGRQGQGRGQLAKLDLADIAKLKAEGLGASVIAKELNIARSSVYRVSGEG
jgi:exopolysaccharide production protein ExoQ